MSEFWDDGMREFQREEALKKEGKSRLKTGEVKDSKKKTKEQKREIWDLNSSYLGKKRLVHLKTKEDVKRFQRENGLKDDGVVWKDTLRKMGKIQGWKESNQSPVHQQEQDSIGSFFSKIFNPTPSSEIQQWIRESSQNINSRVSEKIGTSQELNKQFIAENVPYNWKNIALRSLRHLKNGEIYSPQNPLLLFDTRTSQWVLIYNGRTSEFPISISWYGTLQREMSKAGDHKTPTDWLQHFTDVYIAPTPEADASRSRKWANRGVTSARIESREADWIWQRWVHWMKLWSSTQPATIWCIAIDNHIIRPIAHTIKVALSKWNKAYWYTA